MARNENEGTAKKAAANQKTIGGLIRWVCRGSKPALGKGSNNSNTSCNSSSSRNGNGSSKGNSNCSSSSSNGSGNSNTSRHSSSSRNISNSSNIKVMLTFWKSPICWG